MDRNDVLKERIFSKIIKQDKCWKWMGMKSVEGYGQIYFHGKVVRTHRLLYEIVRGNISHGMVLDHVCENKWCVNPDHLEEVTRVENMTRYHDRMKGSKRQYKTGNRYDPKTRQLLQKRLKRRLK